MRHVSFFTVTKKFNITAFFSTFSAEGMRWKLFEPYKFISHSSLFWLSSIKCIKISIVWETENKRNGLLQSFHVNILLFVWDIQHNTIISTFSKKKLYMFSFHFTFSFVLFFFFISLSLIHFTLHTKHQHFLIFVLKRNLSIILVQRQYISTPFRAIYTRLVIFLDTLPLYMIRTHDLSFGSVRN